MNEKIQNLIIDRAFDVACFKVKNMDKEALIVYNKLKATYPKYTEYIDRLIDFYGNQCKDSDFLNVRANYLIEHPNTILNLKYK